MVGRTEHASRQRHRAGQKKVMERSVPRPLMCGGSPSLRIERTNEELVNHLASAHPGAGGHQAHTQRRLGGSIPMSHQSSFPWSSAE